MQKDLKYINTMYLLPNLKIKLEVHLKSPVYKILQSPPPLSLQVIIIQNFAI